MRQKRAIEAKQAKSLQSEVDLLGTETLAPSNHRITPRSMTELSWSKVRATKVLFARDTTLLQIAKMCGSPRRSKRCGEKLKSYARSHPYNQVA